MQIYHVEEFEAINKLGFRNIIFTLYDIYPSEMDIQLIADALAQNDILAVTFWESWVYDTEESWRNGKEYYETMKTMNIPMCVHTVNDIQDIQKDFDVGVVIVYTDNVDNDY